MANHSSILAWRIPGWRSLVGYSPQGFHCQERVFSLVVASRGHSLVAVLWASRSGFSCCRAWVLGHSGFSSCSTWAEQLLLMGSRAQAQWLLLTGSAAPQHEGSSRTGIKPMSPALAGGLLTTGPPKMSQLWDFQSSLVACGIQFPKQRSNLGPLHWEHGVLASGLPGKSLKFAIAFFFFLIFNEG